MALYNVYRKFQDTGRERLVLEAVTLEEAQKHCNDPETSSDTCTSKTGKERTRRWGSWFDLMRERK